MFDVTLRLIFPHEYNGSPLDEEEEDDDEQEDEAAVVVVVVVIVVDVVVVLVDVLLNIPVEYCSAIDNLLNAPVGYWSTDIVRVNVLDVEHVDPIVPWWSLDDGILVNVPKLLAEQLVVIPPNATERLFGL